MRSHDTWAVTSNHVRLLIEAISARMITGYFGMLVKKTEKFFLVAQKSVRSDHLHPSQMLIQVLLSRMLESSPVSFRTLNLYKNQRI